ncbi:MAG: F0F1 ATP synthase subunit A [Acidobacteriota bacterium]
MEHHSILYEPVNRLLLALLGPPPVARLSPGAAAFFFPDGTKAWIPDMAIMALLVMVIFAVLFPLAARRYDRKHPGRVQNFLELIVESIRGLIEDVIGHGSGKLYLPVIGAFALYIFVANLFGLFFFLQPPTASLSTTVALAVASFFYFNAQGIKANGFWGYIKHFLGPVWWLAPLFFVIEIIGNFARILSLSLRLFMNISGEHTVTGFFASLAPILLPWPLMALGLFTALLQSFIFITLTAVYINLMTAHEEH